MRAWAVQTPGPMSTHPLVPVDLPLPEPASGEVMLRVSTCGVCRTDLHLAEGDLEPHRLHTVPGHEVVGTVEKIGPASRRFRLGQRIGVAWLRGTCGVCHWCRRGAENLCVTPRFTGWDADGGFAEFTVVNEAFAYELPDSFDDEHAAPLLCAGIIGYRALKRAELPPGGRLAIYGFGASAHLAAQVALAQGATVHVLTRAQSARDLALSIGVHSVGPGDGQPPEPVDAAILFAPAGELVPVALAGLERGGTLALAGIYLSDVPRLDYQEHLFMERQVRSVTANTRADGEEFLALADRLHLRVTTSPYELGAADRALEDLAADRVTGAAVLLV